MTKKKLFLFSSGFVLFSVGILSGFVISTSHPNVFGNEERTLTVPTPQYVEIQSSTHDTVTLLAPSPSPAPTPTTNPTVKPCPSS